MASQTLRPHRSPSPSPSPSSTPVNPINPAKLTRQSLGPPPTASAGAARGFGGLGISPPSYPHPRHVSSSVALGLAGNGVKESLSPRPSLGTPGSRGFMPNSGRPSSEFLPGGVGREAKTPEAEQIDQWFQHLASWEQTLEEMAAASTDQNFTEELGAIEQWFRVLSEAERTAALYSLLQHSTPVQIRFFLSVLHHMAQSDPMTALLSPNPAQGAGGMESKLAGLGLKSPSAGGGSGFPGSPTGNHYLAPESADQNKSRLRQNRISAPGTLQPSDRWHGQLDQVIERGTSPGMESNTSSRSKSPGFDPRPKSTDFAGKMADGRPSHYSGGVGLGIGHPEPTGSPITSPFLNNGSWASMVNTPLVPVFNDPKVDLGLANLQLNANRVALDDVRQYRRQVSGTSGTSRNVSGQYSDNRDLHNSPSAQPGQSQTWARSPVLEQYGLGMGDPSALSGLGMNLLNPLANSQMLALAQVQAQQLNTAASFASAGYGGMNMSPRDPRSGSRVPPGRKSPMLGKAHSPTPDRGGPSGGVGGGAGVAGPDDVDMKVLEDVSNWLRVLRLHKYTTNFEKSNWREMIMMTAADLTGKGVSAQGARTKFLKVFYNIRDREGIPHPAGQEEFAPGAGGKDEK